MQDKWAGHTAQLCCTAVGFSCREARQPGKRLPPRQAITQAVECSKTADYILPNENKHSAFYPTLNKFFFHQNCLLFYSVFLLCTVAVQVFKGRRAVEAQAMCLALEEYDGLHRPTAVL